MIPEHEAGVVVTASQERLGIALAPDGSPNEAEGVLNPAIARDRAGVLLMYPRMVAHGNVSRIGLVRGHEDEHGALRFERIGIALEAQAPYERRTLGHGEGCEDPRVTFIAELDTYVMAYTAYGDAGPRIALAASRDGYAWDRLGLLRFADDALNRRGNKDAAFFPEPVRSPGGVWSFALYHRPMLASSVNGQTPIPEILALDPAGRECTCLAYVPVALARKDIRNLCQAAESVHVLPVDERWGWLKNGAGTPPVRTKAGWLSVFHGVDGVARDGAPGLVYRAGLVVQDLERPDRVLYRSPEPLLGPVTADERFGTVDDVVFPTGIDPLGGDAFDIYYGAADAKIARARLHVTVSVDGV